MQPNNSEAFVDINEDILVSGQAFHALCKYNLDDRYPIRGYDNTLTEGDLVFLKVLDIEKFIANPPSKRVKLLIANNDETFIFLSA